MTKIYNRKGDLIFQDKSLSLREGFANLREANLNGANLSANLREANLNGASFDLREANLRGASFDCLTIFPNGKTINELLNNKGE